MNGDHIEPWEINDRIRARVSEVFEQYDLSSITTPAELMQRVQDIHGKPVIVDITSDRDISSTTALWWDLEDEAHVLLRDWDEPYYQVRGLHHEFAHMIFNHPGCTALPNQEAVSRAVPEGAVVRGRTPLGPSIAALLSGDRQIEGEAEYLSSLLARQLLRPSYTASDRVFG